MGRKSKEKLEEESLASFKKLNNNSDYTNLCYKLSKVRRQIKFLKTKEVMLLKLREGAAKNQKKYMARWRKKNKNYIIEYREKKRLEKLKKDGQVSKGTKTAR